MNTEPCLEKITLSHALCEHRTLSREDYTLCLYVLSLQQTNITVLDRISSLRFFYGFRVVQSLVFCVMYWKSLFVCAFSVLPRFTVSDYSFGIFKRLLT